MRANSPVGDFSVLNAPDEQSATETLPKEVKELAKAAQSAQGKIIIDHLKKRVDNHTEILKTMKLTDLDPTTALAIVLAAQQVIADHEAVLRDIETATSAVKDAGARDAKRA